MVDSRFNVSVVSFTHFPQTLVKNAAKICHSGPYDSKLVWEPRDGEDEIKAGHWVVKHLLSGDRGHYGPLEHPSITLVVSGYPHSTIQQLTRHRIGCTYDVQSFRHCDCSGNIDIEDLIYVRPVGNGFNQSDREITLETISNTMDRYNKLIDSGVDVETARSILPFDYRQRFVATFNLRSLLHVISVRSKGNAQTEIQDMATKFKSVLSLWTPQIYDWFEQKHRGFLAP